MSAAASLVHDCALRSVRRFRHIHERVEELLRLADEQAIGSEAFDGSHCAPKFISQRTDDRDMGKAGVDEFARDREDQAGLNRRIQRIEKIGERQAGNGIRKRRNRGLHSVPRKIDPFQNIVESLESS